MLTEVETMDTIMPVSESDTATLLITKELLKECEYMAMCIELSRIVPQPSTITWFRTYLNLPPR